MKKLSVVVPCYNEEKALQYYYEEMNTVLLQLPTYICEYIFIDDGSKDGTLPFIKQLAQQDSQVRYLSFSRNFGKESAIFAGLEYAKGDYIVIMDADLQDPPKLLPDMLAIMEEGIYDSVATRRVNRKGEPPIRSWFSRLFYKIMSKISDADIVDGARDYRLMTRRFVDSLLSMKEYNRFSKGLFGWIGYETKWLEFENVERVAGETKWSFFKLLFYSIEGIVAFSTMPLMIAAVFGFLFSFLAIIFIFFILIRTLLYGDPVSGWPSTICIILLLGGIQLVSIGVLGEYLAKTYLEAKRRPIYICKESNIVGESEHVPYL